MTSTGVEVFVDNDFSLSRAYVYINRRTLDGLMYWKDGGWHIVRDHPLGARAPLDTAAFMVPLEGVEPLFVALARSFGDTLPNQGEVKVLREVLEIERGRVDQILKRALS